MTMREPYIPKKYDVLYSLKERLLFIITEDFEEGRGECFPADKGDCRVGYAEGQGEVATYETLEATGAYLLSRGCSFERLPKGLKVEIGRYKEHKEAFSLVRWMKNNTKTLPYLLREAEYYARGLPEYDFSPWALNMHVIEDEDF